MRQTTLILMLFLLAVPAATQLFPAQAQASRGQESMMQDDANLVFTTAAKRDKTLDEMRALGVDVIRLNVIWNRYAPSPQRKTRPSFDQSDPNAYSALTEVDAVVNGAASRGMAVQLTPTVPGPAWASGCKGSASSRRICRPSPTAYGKFVTALGRRYPSVKRWSLGNEPNLKAWLTPQSRSPIIYRNLVRSGSAALHATGHGGDRILLGETAPIGHGGSRSPVDFYKDLFCLSSRGKRLRGSAAKKLACTSYKRLAVTGVAHHPYTSGAGASLNRRIGKGDITLKYISRLSLWLNRAAKAKRIRGGLPIYSTEFGFQTNPPDRFAGTSLRNQAKWINQADYMSWRNSRLRSVAQYELRDEKARAAFQTGLRFTSGKAKPSLAAYRLPIWPVARGKSTKLWLQVRPESQIGSPQSVTIQYRTKGSKKFRTYKKVTVSDKHGFLYTTVKKKAAYWRFLWSGQKSRTASPA